MNTWNIVLPARRNRPGRLIASGLAGLVLAFAPGWTPAAPRIECSESTFDFGKVRNQENVEHTFQIRNTGDAELAISQVRTSCGCTTTRLDQKVIAPGQQVDLTARLSLKGRRGKQEKTITVESNDPATPRYQLRLVGEIWTDIEVRPSEAYLRCVPGQEVTESLILVLSNMEAPFHITSMETNDVAFCEVVLRTEETGRRYAINVRLKGSARKTPGVLAGTLVLHTDCSPYARMEIPVRAFVQEELLVTPSQMLIRGVPDRTPLTRYILVRAFDNSPLTIAGVECPDSRIAVQTEEFGPGHYRIKLSNIAPSKVLDGKIIRIRVKRGSGPEKSFDIPVKVMESAPPTPGGG